MSAGWGSRAPPRIVLDAGFVLDRPRAEDVAAHRRFALDPEAARFLGWTVEEARSAPDSHYAEVVGRFIRGWETGARLAMAIRRTSSGEAEGMVELRPRPTADEADISYLIAPQLQGQGLASRAVLALLRWGASELGLRKATIECDVENAASQRVAEKCGFVLVVRCGDQPRFERDLAAAEP